MSPRSVSTPCRQEFCSKCLSDVYPQCQRNTEIPCPVCHLSVKFETVAPVKTKQPQLYEQVFDLEIQCIFCEKQGNLSGLKCTHNSRLPEESSAKPVEHTGKARSCSYSVSVGEPNDQPGESITINSLGLLGGKVDS